MFKNTEAVIVSILPSYHSTESYSFMSKLCLFRISLPYVTWSLATKYFVVMPENTHW